MRKLFLCLWALAILYSCNTSPVNTNKDTGQSRPGPFNVYRTTTSGTNYPAAAAINGNVIADFAADDISMGVLGHVKNTGSKSAGVGHLIGIFGLAEGNVNNKHYLIGAEGRVNGTSVNNAGVTEIGVLGLSTFIGTHFVQPPNSRYSIGVIGRSEIYAADGKTPLNEGIVANFYAPAPIGGAMKFSIIADEQGWFKSMSSIQLGSQGVNTGSILFSSATTGNITLEPQAGALGNSVLTMPAVTGKLLVSSAVPKTSNSPGSEGQVAFDVNYFYWYAGSRWNRAAKDQNF